MKHHLVLTAALCRFVAVNSHAQDDGGLAKQLANPVVSLISVPFQANWALASA